MLRLLRLLQLLLVRREHWNRSSKMSAGSPGIKPFSCWIPADPSCFLGAEIRIPAHFRFWDDDPSGVLGYWNPCPSPVTQPPDAPLLLCSFGCAPLPLPLYPLSLQYSPPPPGRSCSTWGRQCPTGRRFLSSWSLCTLCALCPLCLLLLPLGLSFVLVPSGLIYPLAPCAACRRCLAFAACCTICRRLCMCHSH